MGNEPYSALVLGPNSSERSDIEVCDIGSVQRAVHRPLQFGDISQINDRLRLRKSPKKVGKLAAKLVEPSLPRWMFGNEELSGALKVLRLCFPVTERLVGEEFFEGAAQFFICEHPPREAWLDQFGGEIPDFLRSFPQAKSIVYLGDVAELEWAVNSALHAA